MAVSCLKDALILTMEPGEPEIFGDFCWEFDRITSVGPALLADEEIPATGWAVLPGFVQTHVHLSQALFRGYADDLPLLTWLQERIWPLEAAHDVESLQLSARLGLAELIRGGSTCLLDMETVRHTEAAFQVLSETGMRAIAGKVIMTGPDSPPALREDPARALGESLELARRWDGAAAGRLHYALSPRFALSVEEEVLEEIGRMAAARGLRLHTHASEHPGEVAEVRRRWGVSNISYLERVGLLGPRTVLAHAVHLEPGEAERLAATGTKVAHCPSANLKLGSGIADTIALRRAGVTVGLGADGAPCNNRMDMFTEMRLAALLAKVKHGPESLPAREALAMATREGARALGLGDEIGTLRVGKKADFIAVNLRATHLLPSPDAYSAIVYAGQPTDVCLTVVDGRVLYRDGRLTTIDEEALRAEINPAAERVARRAGL